MFTGGGGGIHGNSIWHKFRTQFCSMKFANKYNKIKIANKMYGGKKHNN